ncbi:MAG: DsbA family oxidoreductase [Sulfitobacter sp.]|nr:DsbA family oxidoreductase [Sulfitobacter sp.]
MTGTEAPQDGPVVQVDIVSDVMCPWCIVGFRQLEQALGMVGAGAYVRWHPFELNPDMPPEGQNLREHIMEKYGSTPAQSDANRAHLQKLGADLGIAFNLTDDSRIMNTFAAHQLLSWAQNEGLQHPLKMALLNAHFTQGRDVSDEAVLTDVAASVGLDREAAVEVLSSGRLAEDTRAHEAFWTSKGISGVPSMIFAGKYLLTGAQGAETYAQMLRKIIAENASA